MRKGILRMKEAKNPFKGTFIEESFPLRATLGYYSPECDILSLNLLKMKDVSLKFKVPFDDVLGYTITHELVHLAPFIYLLSPLVNIYEVASDLCDILFHWGKWYTRLLPTKFEWIKEDMLIRCIARERIYQASKPLIEALDIFSIENGQLWKVKENFIKCVKQTIFAEHDEAQKFYKMMKFLYEKYEGILNCEDIWQLVRISLDYPKVDLKTFLWKIPPHLDPRLRFEKLFKFLCLKNEIEPPGKREEYLHSFGNKLTVLSTSYEKWLSQLAKAAGLSISSDHRIRGHGELKAIRDMRKKIVKKIMKKTEPPSLYEPAVIIMIDENGGGILPSEYLSEKGKNRILLQLALMEFVNSIAKAKELKCIFDSLRVCRAKNCEKCAISRYKKSAQDIYEKWQSTTTYLDELWEQLNKKNFTQNTH